MTQLLKTTPLKKKLYLFLNLSEEVIQSGESRFSSSTKEELVKIAESWVYELLTREDCQLNFSDENKAFLVNMIAHGSASIRKKILRNFYHKSINSCGALYSIGLFDLFYVWLEGVENKALETVKKQIFFKYLNDDRTWGYYLEHRDEDGFYIETLASFLTLNYHFFSATERHRVIWKHCYERYSINKVMRDESLCKLGININSMFGNISYITSRCISLHKMENPWNYTDKVLQDLHNRGIDIKISGELGKHFFFHDDIALIKLVFNGVLLDGWFAGPFVTDPDRKRLFCSMADSYSGMILVEIDLMTGQIYRLSSNHSIPIAYSHDGDMLEVYDAKVNKGFVLTSCRAVYYSVPDVLRSPEFINDLEALSGMEDFGFKVQNPPVESVKFRKDLIGPDGALFIIGTFAPFPETYPARVCMDIATGDIIAYHHNSIDRTFSPFSVANNINMFVALLKTYQAAMASATNKEARFVSDFGASEANDLLQGLSVIQSQKSVYDFPNFWDWILSFPINAS